MKTSPINGTILLSIATITFIISGYLINVILGRFLGPADYGTYGVIVSLIAIVNVVQTSGVSQSVSKYVSESKIPAGAILRTGLILQTYLSLIFFFVFYFFPQIIAGILNDNELIPFIKLAAFIFPLYGLHALFMDYYNGLHNFKKQSLMNISYSLSKLVFVLILAYFFKIYGAFIGFLIAPLISTLYGFRFPRNVTIVFPLFKLLKYSFPLIGIAIFSNLLLSIDLFAIKALLRSDTLTGYYAAGQNIAKIIFYCMTAFFLVIFPSISHAVSNNMYDKAKSIIQYSLRTIFLIVCPLMLLLSSKSKDLIEIIYSPLYLPAESSLSILFFGLGAFTLFTAMTYILSGSGKPHIASLISAVSLLISGILCLYLVPIYFLNGAAVATTVGCTVGLIIASIYIYRYFGVLIPPLSFIKIILAALLIYFLALIIKTPLFILPLLYSVLFAIYIYTLLILKEITQEDVKLVKSLIPKGLVKIFKK